MLNYWLLKNFKSISKETRLDLKPLTVFAGPNSSGKSTILQSILLTAQTLQNTLPSKSIILNGHIIRLGTYNDIAFGGNKENPITLGFGMSGSSDLSHEDLYYYEPMLFEDPEIKQLECKFTFTSKTSASGKIEYRELQPIVYDSFYKLSYKNSKNDQKLLVKRSIKSIKERLIELEIIDDHTPFADLKLLEYEVVEQKNITSSRKYNEENKNDIVGAFLNHFLPVRLLQKIDKTEQRIDEIIELLLSTRIFHHYSPEHLTSIFNDFINKEAKEKILKILEPLTVSTETNLPPRVTTQLMAKIKNIKENFSVDNFIDLYRHTIIARVVTERLSTKKEEIEKALRKGKKPSFILENYYFDTTGLEYIDAYFKRKVKYLGPLRDEPKPIYPLSGVVDSKDIGFKGENTAAVLELNRTTLVEHVPPDQLVTSKLPQKDNLINAVLLWLNYMGIASDVDTKDLGKLGHELKIKIDQKSNLSHDLTHVGVGVSQVLPILIQALLAEKDSVLIFEQPELHLHPKVQSRLADFFISMILVKKQCIIETHSEYFINKLRYFVAVDEKDLEDSLALYFVEKENNVSLYRQVKMNKYGILEEWPKGFIDEGENISTSILDAALTKKRQKKNL